MPMSKAQLAVKASRGFKQRYAAAAGAIGGARESAEGGGSNWRRSDHRTFIPGRRIQECPTRKWRSGLVKESDREGGARRHQGGLGYGGPRVWWWRRRERNWRRRKMGVRNVRTRSTLATRACCACVAPAIRESAHADACACQGCRVGCAGRRERARGEGWGWGMERRVRRHTHRNEQPEARRHGAHQRRGSHGWPQTPKRGANPDRTQALFLYQLHTTAGDFRLM